jgi:hypothetical protein
MKKTKVLSLLLLLVPLCASVGRSQSDAEQLSTTAKEFFHGWLVNRKTESALKYLSSKPVLGTCMTPKSLEKKTNLTRGDIQGVFRNALDVTLQKISPEKKVEDLITGSNADFMSGVSWANEVKHPFQKYYTIYSLKPLDDVKDNGFVCKFDERKSLLKTVSSPNVYYLFTRIKVQKKYQPFVLITLWVKEKNEWRILTFSVTTDDN